jgi:hypothetical protein
MASQALDRIEVAGRSNVTIRHSGPPCFHATEWLPHTFCGSPSQSISDRLKEYVIVYGQLEWADMTAHHSVPRVLDAE